MIKHIIMFKFKEECGGKSREENINKLAEMSRGLVGRIPVLRSSATNLNIAASPINYDLVIELSFDSMEDMGEFHVHPLHTELVSFAGEVTESICAVDYEF